MGRTARFAFARTIFTVKSDGPNGRELVDVARNVINDELSALERRAMAQATSLEIPAAPDLLGVLSVHDRPMGDTENSGRSSQSIDIKTIMDNLSQLWAGKARQHFTDADGRIAALTAEICDSVLAGLYFLQTVHELFTTEPDLVTKLAACRVDRTFKMNDDTSLRGLASARTTLGVNPYLAAEIIQDTRKALSCRTDDPVSLTDIEPDFLNPPPAHRTRRSS